MKNGYELVRTPHIGIARFVGNFGHWGFYTDSMYPPLEVGKTLKEMQSGVEVKRPKEEYLLKPMNCPFHVMIYKSDPHSYREIYRYVGPSAATVYRYEKSGEFSGLTRVRGFTQDDAHIICTQRSS